MTSPELLPSEKFDPVVQRRLHAKSRSSGESVLITVMVGHPRSEGKDFATCSVVVDGLFEKLQDIHGIDELDALRNAVNFVEKIIDDAQADYELFWPDGERVEFVNPKTR